MTWFYIKCASFTISLIEFYLITIVIICSCDYTIGIFMVIIFILNYTFRLSVTNPVNMTEMGLKWPNAFLPFSHTWPGYGLPLCLEGAIW